MYYQTHGVPRCAPTRHSRLSSGGCAGVFCVTSLWRCGLLCPVVNMSKADYVRKKNKHLLNIHKWIQAHGGQPLRTGPALPC